MATFCRACGVVLTETFLDLGVMPLANAFLRSERDFAREKSYPLHALVCTNCLLVQVGQVVSPQEIFRDYVYLSSLSRTWHEHCSRYVDLITERLRLGQESSVLEIGSNDGTLLNLFRRKNINVLGIEPAANVAEIANASGVPTWPRFFSRETALDLRAQARTRPDLIVANNVLAHTPDLHDFVSGLKILLAPTGTITIEVPHLARLMAECQFDTIYHEHFSYFTLYSLEAILGRHDLAVFDIEMLDVHGGSIRLYVAHASSKLSHSDRLIAAREAEALSGLHGLKAYRNFGALVANKKQDILNFFASARQKGLSVVGYAAAAKGNTLLNYCGIGSDFAQYVVDRNPLKQGLYLPGSHLYVRDPVDVFETRPDYLFVLAWNLREEILGAMAGIAEWGGQFVFPIPSLEIVAPQRS
jgi:2-polyprenyl-3-methyl-5-hydroxy-6-metoxy-1,4-benzoquinol methylase